MRSSALLLLTLAPAWAQTRPDEFLDHWRMAKQFTLAVAEAMPDEHYKFKPQDEEMPYGALLFHIASAQAFRIAQIAGTESPVAPPQGPLSKADILAALAKSFDFCIARIARFTPEQLDRSYRVDWFERPTVTGRQLVLGMFNHTTHHRGQAEVYLRLKGIRPPAYRF